MLMLTRMTHVIALYYDIKLISGETVVVLLLRSLALAAAADDAAAREMIMIHGIGFVRRCRWRTQRTGQGAEVPYPGGGGGVLR